MRRLIMVLAVVAGLAAAIVAFLCYYFYAQTIALNNYIRTMPARAARHAKNGRAERVDEAQVIEDAQQQTNTIEDEKGN